MYPIAVRIAFPVSLFLAAWAFLARIRLRAVMDEMDFTHAFVAAVKRRWPRAGVDVQAPLQLQVELRGSGQPVQVQLDEAYRLYLAEPQRLGELLRERMSCLEPSPPAAGAPRAGT